MSVAFDKAWGVVKEEKPFGYPADREWIPPMVCPECGEKTDNQSHHSYCKGEPDEIAECQKIAEEFEDEPCVLHGGENDWCWAAALPVNEDGSYCYSMMAGEAGANCACINCEELGDFE